MRDAATFAVALQARDRHACTPAVTCQLCLPPDTRWPCEPWRTAEAAAERLALDFPPAPSTPTG